MNLQILLIVSLFSALIFQYLQIQNLIKSQINATDNSNKLEQQVHLDNKARLLDELQHRKKLKERDVKVVLDPLTPGERRLPAHQVPRGIFKDSINISTRGQPDNFQYLGNLIRDTDDMILPVFGRQEYPGSDFYEYYVMLNQDGNFGLKLPINRGKRIREFEEDEIVEIDYFKSNPGKFKYQPFDYDVPRYNPYDF